MGEATLFARQADAYPRKCPTRIPASLCGLAPGLSELPPLCPFLLSCSDVSEGTR